MKLNQIICTMMLVASVQGFSQVGIGTTMPSGALDITSSNDGMLIPRISLVNTTTATVLTPTISELIYNIETMNDVTPGFYYWDGTKWVRLNPNSSSTGEDWKLVGNNVTDANHFLGTTNWMSLKLKAANTLLGVFEPNGSVFLGSGATGNQNHSFTIGLDANASASQSVSIGTEANSSGYRSQAIGYRARSTADQSVAIGPNALASAESAIAIGNGSSSTQNQSMALGASANVTGNRSTALGYLAVAENDGSLALGYNSTSKGNGSSAIGRESLTNAQYSTAIGYRATTSQNNAIVLGDASDPLSKIGIGTSAPSEKLHVVGNIRIVDGNEANGRVLTSDANGKATWASSVKDFSEAFNNLDVDFPWYSPIAFQNQGLNKNVTFSGGNLQTILAGTYKVTYSVSIRLLSTASVASFSSNFHLRLNGASELANTKCHFTVFRGATTSVSFSKLITVPAYTTVQLWSDIGTNDIKILGGANIRIELLE